MRQKLDGQAEIALEGDLPLDIAHLLLVVGDQKAADHVELEIRVELLLDISPELDRRHEQKRHRRTSIGFTLASFGE